MKLAPETYAMASKVDDDNPLSTEVATPSLEKPVVADVVAAGQTSSFRRHVHFSPSAAEEAHESRYPLRSPPPPSSISKSSSLKWRPDEPVEATDTASSADSLPLPRESNGASDENDDQVNNFFSMAPAKKPFRRTPTPHPNDMRKSLAKRLARLQEGAQLDTDEDEEGFHNCRYEQQQSDTNFHKVNIDMHEHDAQQNQSIRQDAEVDGKPDSS